MVCQSSISTKKSVSFQGHVSSRAALHINDYSEEEKQATWLNAADMQRIHGDIRYTIEMMNGGGTVDEDEWSIGGLEYKTHKGTQIRCATRSASIRAVLNEQYRQEAGHFLDEEELAKVYTGCTSRCQITARLLALSNTRFIRSLDVESTNLNKKKLNPEISFVAQTAPCGRILRRIFQRRQTSRNRFGTTAT